MGSVQERRADGERSEANHVRRRRRVLIAGVVALSLGLVAACSSTSTSTTAPSTTPGSTPDVTVDEGTPVDGGKLVVAVPAETPGWNPTTAEWASYSAMVGSSMLESLATVDPHGTAQPWLATSFTPNATFDSWTLKLRSDVTFQDGTPFDAAAVKMNLDSALVAPVSSQALAGAFKAVTVVDPLTVRVDLDQPWASFPSSYLAGQSALMMAPSALNAEDKGAKHPIGTGPFTFESWQPDSVLRVKKNPTYWQKGLPHLESIEFRIIADANSAKQALSAGDVDAFETTSADIANGAEGTSTIVRDWNTEPSMLITNTLPALDGVPNPLGNAHARMALALATDRDAIAASVGDGVKVPTSPFSPESPWGRPEGQNHYPNFDLELAKQEVAAYEKDTRQTSLTLTLTGTSDINAGRIMQMVQSQWQQAGIEVKIEALEGASLISRVVVGKYQVAFFSFYTSPDPDQDRYFWSASTAQGYGKLSINFTQYTNPDMEKALQLGRSQPDFDTRKAAYNQVVDQINAATTNIWLFWTPYSIISTPRVKGLQAAAVQHFANFQPKTFWPNTWIAP